MKANPIVWIFLLLTLAGCQTKTSLSNVVIYYVPFQFTSNESVTPDNIKEKANSIEVTDRRALAYLEKLLAKGHEGSGFDDKRVRTLILLAPGNRSIWVDAEGNLLEAGHQRRLDRKQFDDLENFVSSAVSTGGEMK